MLKNANFLNLSSSSKNEMDSANYNNERILTTVF